MAIYYLQRDSDRVRKDRAFSVYKISGSVGYIVGGVVSPLIYVLLGYYYSFMLYCFFFTVFLIAALFIVPSDKEFKEYLVSISSHDSTPTAFRSRETQERQVGDTMFDLIKNKYIFLTLMGLFLSLCCLMTIIPTLTIMLNQKHNIGPEIAYYFFAVQEIGFLISQLIPYIYPNQRPLFSNLVKLSFIVIAFGLFLTGPSNLIDIHPEEAAIPLLIVGLFTEGFGVGMLLILGNIQLMRIAKRDFID